MIKRRSYLKANGELIADDKGVAIIEYWYDEKGREIKRLFSGVDGRRCFSSDLIAGWKNFYDDKGNLCRQSYVGMNGGLKNNINGVAIVDFVYDDNNNMIEKTFFNTCTNLVSSRDGDVAGFRCKYDSHGNKIEEYTIDAKRRILKNKNNVSIASFGYNNKRQCVERRFYDGNRIRINSKEGIGGWLSEYDERGNEIKRRWIDKGDNPCSVNGSYGWVRKYDNRNRVVESADLAEDGFSTFSKLEILGHEIICDKTTLTYDHLGRREAWFASKTPKGFWGADMIAVKYSQSENINRIRLLNNETNLVDSSLGYARKEIKYNENDELIEESNWNADNSPATLRNSAAHRIELKYHRSSSGLIWESHWYGTNGFHVLDSEQKAASIIMKFDDQRRLLSGEWFGIGGIPACLKGTNIIKVFCKYDDKGRVISIKYRTIDGKGCTGDKIAGFEIEYLLNNDKEVLVTFLDENWNKLDVKRLKEEEIQPFCGISKFRFSKELINQFCK